jgi:DNA-directed RNA polymerase subunit RPC12/RpoP
MIKFQCSNCNHKLGVEEKYAGKRVRCPKCRTAIRVPEPVEKKEIREQGVIKFRCPSCNQKIGLKADYAGKRVRCSKCRNPLLVPQASAETGRAAIKDETEVLRAGQEQLAGDEGFWGEPGTAGREKGAFDRRRVGTKPG